MGEFLRSNSPSSIYEVTNCIFGFVAPPISILKVPMDKRCSVGWGGGDGDGGAKKDIAADKDEKKKSPTSVFHLLV